MMNKARCGWVRGKAVMGGMALWSLSLSAAVSDSLLREGIALSRAGKHEAALETLRRAVASDPSDPGGYTALGTAALEGQYFPEAQSAFQRAVDLDPHSQTALYGLAMLFEKTRQFPAARSAWEKFLSLSPSNDMRELARRHLERLP